MSQVHNNSRVYCKDLRFPVLQVTWLTSKHKQMRNFPFRTRLLMICIRTSNLCKKLMIFKLCGSEINHFNIILISTTISPNLSRSFEFVDINFLWISYLSHAWHLYRRFHFHLITLLIFGKKYKSWLFTLSNFPQIAPTKVHIFSSALC